MAKKRPDWEKLTVYITIVGSLATLFVYLVDIKVSIAKLEVRMEHLEKNAAKTL